MTTCSACSRALTPVGGQRAAEHDTVRGVLDGAPAHRCPEGHETLTADLDAVVGEAHDLLDIAERTRIRGTLRCAACQTPYRLPGRRSTRSITLVATGLPATRVTLDVPMLRCTEDAIESIPPECVGDLDAVLRSLLAPPP